MRRRDVLSALTGALACALPARVNAAGFSADLDDDEVAAEWFGCERRFKRHGSSRIAYMDQGKGPGALFIHGFPLSSFQWRGLMARLLGERRCIVPDLMGLGYTEVAPGAEIGPDAQVTMLLALLDALGMKAVDVIANDSGGTVAQLLLVRAPARVRSLLLTNGDVETDSPPAALQPVFTMARAGAYPDEWLVPWLADKAQARSPAGIGGMCYSSPLHPTDAALEQYLAPLVATAERKALTNRYALALEPNALLGIEARLRKMNHPVGVVWGMRDTIFAPTSCEYLERIFRNFQGVRRVTEGKLFFPEEYPDLMAEEARRLWARNAPPES